MFHKGSFWERSCLRIEIILLQAKVLLLFLWMLINTFDKSAYSSASKAMYFRESPGRALIMGPLLD